VKWVLSLLVLLLAIFACFYWWRLDWLERSQDRPIRAAARRYAVDPALVKAIVWQESRFNQHVRGRAGEMGLMQIREEAAREWAEAERVPGFDYEQCMDPATNTMAGTWYLKKILNRYTRTDNPLPYALADYNAGRGNVLKWNSGEAMTNSAAFMSQIGFPGTKAYVASVLARYEYYRPRFR
jgi:peptidoglycan lytic transglycosylase